MDDLQQQLNAAMSAAEQTRSGVHAAEARLRDAAAGRAGDGMAAAEAAAVKALAQAELARLRERLREHTAAVDAALGHVRAMEGRLEAARAAKTAAYAQRVTQIAGSIAAKHRSAPATVVPAVLEAAVEALQGDLDGLRELAAEASHCTSSLHSRYEQARIMGDEWHVRAAELSSQGEVQLAAEARARSAALEEQSVLLRQQLRLLSKACAAVKRCIAQVDQRLTRARVARDTAAAAQPPQHEALQEMERSLGSLRRAAEAAAESRQVLQSRYDVAAGTADFWQGWAEKQRSRGNAAEEASALQRGRPHADHAALLRQQLEQTAEAADTLMLSVRILEARLAEAAAWAAADRAGGEGAAPG